MPACTTRLRTNSVLLLPEIASTSIPGAGVINHRDCVSWIIVAAAAVVVVVLADARDLATV